MKKWHLFIIILILFAVAAIALWYVNKKYTPVQQVSFVNNSPGQSIPPQKDDVLSSPNYRVATKTENTAPNTLLLKVPFTSQAPTANWDALHNEDCEEASVIMASEYFKGNTNPKLDAKFVEEQLTTLTNWEKNKFGYNLDISSEEVVQIIEANYNLHATIVTNFSENDIKNELAQNHLVLIPENGQLIGNPNYKQPGPKYHMLVVRGFTTTSLITNDPGTRNGLNYPYAFKTLYNANGDWSHETNTVNLNKKNIILVWK